MNCIIQLLSGNSRVNNHPSSWQSLSPYISVNYSCCSSAVEKWASWGSPIYFSKDFKDDDKSLKAEPAFVIPGMSRKHWKELVSSDFFRGKAGCYQSKWARDSARTFIISIEHSSWKLLHWVVNMSLWQWTLTVLSSSREVPKISIVNKADDGKVCQRRTIFSMTCPYSPL